MKLPCKQPRNFPPWQSFIPQTLVKQTADDFQLVEAFRSGDERAFEQIIRRYQHQVANIIYLTLGSREEIEDLSQEVFIRVYKSLDRFEFDASLYSWIYRIAVNLCIDEIRRRKIRKAVSLEFFTERRLEEEKKSKDKATAADPLLREEKQQVIVDALQKLSPGHRAVLLLREYEDLSYVEIARTLHISPQAVKSRIFRAREELRTLLKGYFKERT
ncbi:MAG: sigma-70 family RNA polymerase sigma factor [Ignavibacteria bacterium]|nr:sigma-70 family RNA polymerase sigma factor [Ignavibacteria bacterium]